MSKYQKYRTEFTDREMFLKAVQSLGVPVEIASEGQTLPLYGYKGDRRRERAHVVIRRQHINPASNDLGYVWDEKSRAWVAIVSDYDSRCADTVALRKRIKQGYTTQKLIRDARRMGLTLVKKRTKDGQIRLTIQGELTPAFQRKMKALTTRR